ncbi:MAG: hypothetical protein LUQ01_03765, partial [Methanolinea sp.]|nr:hypothetical protein [Methanolinea sp.]
IPPIHKSGIHLWEEDGKRKRDVVALTFLSRSGNALLSTLLRKVLPGDTKIRYDDFSLLFPDFAASGGIDRIGEAFSAVMAMDVEEMARLIPLPPRENWKFGAAIPEAMVREMAIRDTWKLEEFSGILSELRIYPIQPNGKKTG